MALIKRGVTFLMIIMSAIHVSNASVHKVGDSSGWTIIGNIDYKNWAATKNFNIGDTISKSLLTLNVCFLNCGRSYAVNFMQPLWMQLQLLRPLK